MQTIKEKNPFECVGVYIDKNGKAEYRELKNGSWLKFRDYPDCSLCFDEKYWTWKVYTFQHRLSDWIDDNGYNNLGDWVEEAAKRVGR